MHSVQNLSELFGSEVLESDELIVDLNITLDLDADAVVLVQIIGSLSQPPQPGSSAKASNLTVNCCLETATNDVAMVITEQIDYVVDALTDPSH